MAEIKKINPVSSDTREAIRRQSAALLPDRPSAAGWSAESIRKTFYAPVLAATSALGEIDRVVEEINAYNKEKEENDAAALEEKVDKTTKINGHAMGGDVTLTKGDVELGNVDNTADTDKPVSAAQQAALDLLEAKCKAEHDYLTSRVPHAVSMLENDEGFLTEGDFQGLFYDYMTKYGMDAFAHTSKDLAYSLSSDGTYYICTGIGECLDTELVIPPSHEGLPVRKIAAIAFRDNKTITGLILPNTVTYIGQSAFKNCTALTDVRLGDGVETMGMYGFIGCTALSHVVLGKGLQEIAPYTFHGCTLLQSIVIERGTERIGDSAFYNCTSLESIVIPDTVTSIGQKVFYKTALKSVTLPDSLRALEYRAFYQATALEGIVIPDSVINMGDEAFSLCSKLMSVTVGTGLSEIPQYAFYQCNALTTVYLRNQYTGIAAYAFRECGALQSLVTGDGGNEAMLTENPKVGAYAFYHCTSLRSVCLPARVESIETYAFCTCTYLVSVTCDDAACLAEIGDYAFRECSNLSSFPFASCTALETVGNHAFYSCYALQEVSLAASRLTTIGDYAFYYCLMLTRVSPGGWLQTIGDYAFYNCCNLRSFSDVGNDALYCYRLASIGAYAFYNCQLTSIQFSDNLISLGSYAFDHNSILTNVIFGTALLTIPERAFSNCKKLQSVTIPDENTQKMTTINSSVFYACSLLTEILLPASMRSISPSAFSTSGITTIRCRFAEDTVNGSPWGATGASVVYV